MEEENREKEFWVVPSCYKGNGIGHLKRMANLAKQSDKPFHFILKDGKGYFSYNEMKLLLPENSLCYREEEFFKHPIVKKNRNRVIFLDRRKTTTKEWKKYSSLGDVLLIDDGGTAIKKAEYALNVLPPSQKKFEGNRSLPALLNLTEKREWRAKPIKKVLATFGGEDPYGLTKKFVQFWQKFEGEKKDEAMELTVVIGPLAKPINIPKNIKVLRDQKKLKTIFDQYDAVVTSFGITPYEVASRGVPLALFNPTRYHQKLAKKTEFYILGNPQKIDESRWANFLTRKEWKKEFDKILSNKDENAFEFLNSLEFEGGECPRCHKVGEVKMRFYNKTYYTCPKCTLTYMTSPLKENISYNEAYFFEDYQKQYGKSYLDDFNHIKELGKVRLGRIKSLIKLEEQKEKPSILDIGCAYGPFLSACKEGNFSPFGVEPAQEAVFYTEKTLEIPVIQGFFPIRLSSSFPKKFDAITMWYVIEHFQNLDDVLKEVSSLLKKGAVFAFSTPNEGGAWGRSKNRDFLENSPADHYTVWSRKSAKKVLKKYGFKVKKFHYTGFHPERVTPFWQKLIKWCGTFLGLGDTFEVYCVKK